jgi:D-methionine transport system substrate-binding protein
MIVTESAPYQEPTKIAQKLLAAQGWKLEPTYVTDIVQPNLAVANGEYDVNFFQHNAYLDQFNKDKGLDIVGLFYVYSGPGGIWSNKYKSLKELPDGAKIGIPVDTANNGRALFLLRSAGLLELSKAPVVHTSQENITANPKNLKFVEVDQQSLVQTLPDVDAGFLIARMAADAGHSRKDALAFESETDQLPFRIVVAGRPDFAGTAKAKALKQAYQSPEVKAWFKNYQGGILPTPWDADPAADMKKLQEQA